MPASPIRKLVPLANQAKAKGIKVYHLNIGQPDLRTPEVAMEAMRKIDRTVLEYSPSEGIRSFREKLVGYYAKFNINVDVDDIIITTGGSEAVFFSFMACLDPGDEIIYNEPCYVSYASEIRMAHGVPVPVATYEKNGFALDPADLEKAVTTKTKAILLNFPCNPTGAVLNMDQLEKIAKIAVKYDLLVLADLIYSELTYAGGILPAISSLPGMKERTVFLHGFSKAFAMTGFRIGYACGPAEIIDAMMKIHQYSMLCASITAQEAAEEALKNGIPERERMRLEYRNRRNVIVKGLNKMGLPCYMAQGAFYVFPNITSTGLSSVEFAKRLLKEKRVAVVPGSAFGASGEGYVRCSYATSMEGIREALKRMEAFLKSLKK